VSAARWTRTEDGASETLTVVRVDGQDALAIQITTGPETGDDFVGLYDLDGDQLETANCAWGIVDASEIPADVIESIERDWESGTSVVRRIEVRS
jgi:hypothetical protein